jgi:sugar phosphate isomerase/epimerase
MIQTGLVSVSFRHLNPIEIIKLVVQARLNGIEWGGDIHVPHGNLSMAKEVSSLTKDHGLEVTCYGSYYKIAVSEEEEKLEFKTVLDTAKQLGSKLIRVWASNRSSSEANEVYWNKLIADAIRINELAKAASVRICLEFHANTITDSVETTIRLLKNVCSENFTTLWQPRHNISADQNLSDLCELKPWLSNIHVFHWWPDRARLPLQAGKENWLKYLGAVNDMTGRYALLEFFKDDSTDQFLKDAKILKAIIGNI